MLGYEELKQLLSELEKSNSLSDSQVSTIKESYLSQFGKELNLKKKCRNCLRDAVIELCCATSPNHWTMVGGAIVDYKGVLYTRKNISDAIAMQIIIAQPENKRYFLKIRD